ncbi:unnamed protein product [Porites evermanni]|uniref:Uncharacterized protein n=1 Tax=Porites evermanni TaxID=104178 RepID=A0ABN8MNZ2_9CNID|nr:unnamed protein product [Porites evermanni]
MGKESSGTSPNGRGSAKWPEIQEIIQARLLYLSRLAPAICGKSSM